MKFINYGAALELFKIIHFLNELFLGRVSDIKSTF
jgi:hypothetical protein